MTDANETRMRPLGLLPADNPKFKALWDQGNGLAREFDELNMRVLLIRVPAFRFWTARKELRDIAPALRNYQTVWNDWDSAAREFSLNPRLIIPTSDTSAVALLHVTAELRFLIDERWNCMRLLEGNYNGKWGSYHSQRNLILSWVGIVVGFLGAALSLLSVWLALPSKNP